MTFGIMLSLCNHIFFKDYLSIWFEFIPRLVFILCTFGYMIFMVIFKWCVEWNPPECLLPSNAHEMICNPPNLIQTMIEMFLSPGSVASDKQLYSGQGIVQAILLVLAVFSVPVMLFAKPYAHKRAHLAKQKDALLNHLAPNSEEYSARKSDDDKDGKDDKEIKEHTIVIEEGGHGGGHGGEFSFSDELIHNSIHTIEYVLGTVSNTASYLRLWALSLAHAELAQVFWDKMMAQYGYQESSPIFIVIGFAVWFAATFAVLLCMDVLECFLHALRLHWVEFQNKFYYADGIAFEPFNFEVVIANN